MSFFCWATARKDNINNEETTLFRWAFVYLLYFRISIMSMHLRLWLCVFGVLCVYVRITLDRDKCISIYISLYHRTFLLRHQKIEWLDFRKWKQRNIIFVQATRYEMRLSKNVPPRIKWHTWCGRDDFFSIQEYKILYAEVRILYVPRRFSKKQMV